MENETWSGDYIPRDRKIIMTSQLIPKGYVPVAHSEKLKNIATIYYNKERRMFMFNVNRQLLGPISLESIDVLMNTLNDVREMRGRYYPIVIPDGPDDAA